MFEKKRCISNIYFLAKDQGKKIGDIEKQAGVSAGYISRINKVDSNTNPGIEFLLSVSNELGVSLDALINYDFEALTLTEAYIVNFAERLIQQTEYYKLTWKKEPADYLKAPIDESGVLIHPLFSYDDSCEIIYWSRFLPDERLVVVGDGYYATINDGAMIYLMKVRREVDPDQESMMCGMYDIYEMYLLKGSEVVPLCYSGPCMDSPYEFVLQKLYYTIEKSSRNIQVRPDVKDILDTFMFQTGDKMLEINEEDPDELPFE